MVIVAYATAIQQAIATGDLARMRKVQKLAESHLRDYGNVAAAYEVLRAEIMKLEYQQKRRATRA
jgi:hypothetical protein